MKEYKILRGSEEACEKTLNLWRDNFYVNILSMCASTSSAITILLTRERLEDVPETDYLAKELIYRIMQ